MQHTVLIGGGWARGRNLSIPSQNLEGPLYAVISPKPIAATHFPINPIQFDDWLPEQHCKIASSIHLLDWYTKSGLRPWMIVENTNLVCLCLQPRRLDRPEAESVYIQQFADWADQGLAMVNLMRVLELLHFQEEATVIIVIIFAAVTRYLCAFHTTGIYASSY